MPTSPSPLDDRFQGLAERPDAPFFGADALLSASVRCPASDWQSMEQQLEIACRHGALIERVAADHGVLLSIIAGFCSRRSGWGLDLLPVGIDGTRDIQARDIVSEERTTPLPPDGLGFERGLMGLDYDRRPLARDGGWRDPERNVDAAFALIACYRTLLRRRTTLQGTGLLRASLTAFECGIERVERALRHGFDVDSRRLAGGLAAAAAATMSWPERASFRRPAGTDTLGRWKSLP